MELRQQPKRVSQIDYFSDMVVGVQKQQKTVMSRLYVFFDLCLSKFKPVILITRSLIPIICLTCCTASTTHKKSCVGACSHAVRVMSYELCMLREIYFLSFDVGIRRKICSRILRDATEGCAEDV